MRAVLESDNGWRATLHVDEDAKNLITAPACRGSCMEPVLQALLGFQDYERFLVMAKKYPLNLSDPYGFGPPSLGSFLGIQLVVDL